MAEKVRLREDYNYNPKLPDFFELFGAVAGASTLGAKYYFRGFVRDRKYYGLLLGYAAGGYILGSIACRIRGNFLKKKMIWTEDYIASHPEEFQEGTPKKFKDVLLPWHPAR